MLHPAFELRKVDDQIGFGVFATELVPKGTITWALDPLDQILTPTEQRRLPEVMRPTLFKYAYIDAAGARVLCWDVGKYVNHSCRPAAVAPGLPVELALRDLHPGDELTCDYGFLNIEEPFPCLCGSEGCRQQVRREDASKMAPVWDAALRSAVQHFRDVAQPLLSIVGDPAPLIAASRDPSLLPSCMVHHVSMHEDQVA